VAKWTVLLPVSSHSLVQFELDCFEVSVERSLNFNGILTFGSLPLDQQSCRSTHSKSFASHSDFCRFSFGPIIVSLLLLEKLFRVGVAQE